MTRIKAERATKVVRKNVQEHFGLKTNEWHIIVNWANDVIRKGEIVTETPAEVTYIYRDKLITVNKAESCLTKAMKVAFVYEGVIVWDHAFQRVKDRVGLDDEAAKSFIERGIRHSFEIMPRSDRNGTPGILKAYNGKAFIFSEDMTMLRTVMVPKENARHKRIQRAAKEEAAKVIRKFESRERSLLRLEAEIEAEKAERKLQLLRARSTEKKLVIKARIAALDLRLADIEPELGAIISARNEEAMSLVAVI